MPFQKGMPKPAGSGIKKGGKHKKKLLKIDDFLRTTEKDLAREIYETAQAIDDPEKKAKILLELYSFIDTKPKEKTSDEEQTSQDVEPASILEIISNQ